MFGFAEYVMPEVWVERFGRHQVNFSSKQIFKEFGKIEKIIKGLLSRLKLHEKINVALVGWLAAGEGAEHAETPDAEAAKARAILTQQRENLIFRRY
jgi:hypothetical protein